MLSARKARDLLRAALETEIRWLEETADAFTGLGLALLIAEMRARANTLRATLREIDGPNHIDGHVIAGNVQIRKGN